MASSPIDASLSELIGVYTDFKASVDAEVTTQNTSVQIIDVNLPDITRCPNIKISEDSDMSTTIIQVSNSDTMDAMATLVNSKIDAQLNQLNDIGKKYLKKDVLKIKEGDINYDNVKLTENTKNTLHTSVFVGVKSFVKSNTTNFQKISFNPNGTARYLECKTLEISIKSKINTQITQLTTLILDSVQRSSGTYGTEINGLLDGSNKEALGNLFPSVFTAGTKKLLYFGSGLIGLVLLFGIFAILIVIVIRLSGGKKKNIRPPGYPYPYPSYYPQLPSPAQ